MSKKLRRYCLLGILMLLGIMLLTVPSTQEYDEWLTKNYRINCDRSDCIHSTIDPMANSIKHFPFVMIAETNIFDDPNNSIKVLGVFNTFMPLRNNLKSKDSYNQEAIPFYIKTEDGREVYFHFGRYCNSKGKCIEDILRENINPMVVAEKSNLTFAFVKPPKNVRVTYRIMEENVNLKKEEEATRKNKEYIEIQRLDNRKYLKLPNEPGIYTYKVEVNWDGNEKAVLFFNMEVI